MDGFNLGFLKAELGGKKAMKVAKEINAEVVKALYRIDTYRTEAIKEVIKAQKDNEEDPCWMPS